MLPSDLVDHILSFCEGHVRADLRVKNVGIPLRHSMDGLIDKLLLEQTYVEQSNGSRIYFVNKRDYCNLSGYVSKMVDIHEVLYTWIQVNWF